MNLGNKNYRNHNTLGVKNYTSMSRLGNKAPHEHNPSSNHSTPDIRMGIHNVSNSNASAMEPMGLMSRRNPQSRQMSIEKQKPRKLENGKFA